MAAAAALVLSGCGGGGGPSAPGPNPTTSSTGRQPGQPHLGAGGVSVAVSRDAGSGFDDTEFTIGKGGTDWTVDPLGINIVVPTNWAKALRIDAATEVATEFLFATTNIEAETGSAPNIVVDDDYLAYGFWSAMGAPTDGSTDKVPAGDVVPFHYGSKPSKADDIKAVAGTGFTAVAYTGNAAGGYKSTPTGGEATRGFFYGTVALTANFEDGTISGDISSITTGGNQPLLSSTTVTLSSASFVGKNKFSGTTTTGATTTDGSWSGFFYGGGGGPASHRTASRDSSKHKPKKAE